MAHELGIEKKMVGINVERTLDRKVVKKFGQPGDSGKTVAYIRALEEAVRGYLLTVEDLKEIERENEAALERRMEKRRKGRH